VSNMLSVTYADSLRVAYKPIIMLNVIESLCWVLRRHVF